MYMSTRRHHILGNLVYNRKSFEWLRILQRWPFYFIVSEVLSGAMKVFQMHIHQTCPYHQWNGITNELAVLLHNLLHPFLFQVFHLVFFHMKDNLRSSWQCFLWKTAHGERPSSSRLPQVLFVVIVLGVHFNLVSNQVSWVEPHTKLTNHGDVSASLQETSDFSITQTLFTLSLCKGSHNSWSLMWLNSVCWPPEFHMQLPADH